MMMMKVGSQKLELHQCFRMKRSWYCLHQGNLLHKQRRRYNLLEYIPIFGHKPALVVKVLQRISRSWSEVYMMCLEHLVRC
uniref:Uncharacterized protein n=1 Tax=Brassica oleracea TaxID=3712 RepID=A0A3P6FUD7_BRAOL|nr:unnamed protein product [Brassica oleracea]